MALLIGRGERSAPGLRLLSRPRFWPSRRRSGCVLVGLDGCEVRRCDPCALVRARVSRVCPVCYPAPPGVFLPIETGLQQSVETTFHVRQVPNFLTPRADASHQPREHARAGRRKG
jgi:hypothetical protein